MYQFFPAQSRGNDILIYDPQDQSSVLHTFTFPRQSVEPYLCLADFLKPVDSGIMDYVGFLVVTAGHGVREMSTVLKEKGITCAPMPCRQLRWRWPKDWPSASIT